MPVTKTSLEWAEEEKFSGKKDNYERGGARKENDDIDGGGEIAYRLSTGSVRCTGEDEGWLILYRRAPMGRPRRNARAYVG